MARKQVLHKHFPEPINAMVPVPAMQDPSLEENFHQAIQLFIQQILSRTQKSSNQKSLYQQMST
jgi:hypothetical protein